MEANGNQINSEVPVKTLREWRDEQGRTWTWLAGRAGVSYPAFMFYLRTSRWPGAAVSRIAEALGITPDQIADTAPPESTEAPAQPSEPRASADVVSERRGGKRRAADVA